jgi:hypothetical protein
MASRRLRAVATGIAGGRWDAALAPQRLLA